MSIGYSSAKLSYANGDHPSLDTKLTCINLKSKAVNCETVYYVDKAEEVEAGIMILPNQFYVFFNVEDKKLIANTTIFRFEDDCQTYFLLKKGNIMNWNDQVRYFLGEYMEEQSNKLEYEAINGRWA
jgi:hypothetical protein